MQIEISSPSRCVIHNKVASLGVGCPETDPILANRALTSLLHSNQNTSYSYFLCGMRFRNPDSTRIMLFLSTMKVIEYVCVWNRPPEALASLNSDYWLLLVVDYFWKRHNSCSIFNAEKTVGCWIKIFIVLVLLIPLLTKDRRGCKMPWKMETDTQR